MVPQDQLTRKRFLQIATGGALGLTAAGGTVMAQQHDMATPVPEASPVATPFAESFTANPTVRRNASSLTTAEKQAFTRAVLQLKTMTSPFDPSYSAYDQFVVWHRDAFHCDNMSAHMGPAFFPWHRMFVRLFELMLQRIDPTVFVPYWDWTVDNQIDSSLWQADLLGGNGDPNQQFGVVDGPFQKGKFQLTVFDESDPLRLDFIVRNLGDSDLAPDLPTAADVESGLAMTEYDADPWNELADPTVSFRNYVEGWRDCVPMSCASDPDDFPNCPGPHLMHNRVHLWVSGEEEFGVDAEPDPGTPATAERKPFGTMAMNSSPNDPVFFLHHANIDRIWSAWLEKNPGQYLPESGAMPGHNRNDQMWPYKLYGITLTPGDLLTTDKLGYSYDTAAGE